MSSRDYIFITGASSGIGQACARRLAEPGKVLMLNARRAEKLQALCRELEASKGCTCLALAFDVRDKQAMLSALEAHDIDRVDVLINNAGLALGMDPLQAGPTEDWEVMIDTNLKGLLYLTRAMLPGMAERGYGHVINIGSIAGRDVYQGGVVYASTKAAVETLTQGMRMELIRHGIKVSLVAPGAVDTGFSLVRFGGDAGRAAKVYEGYEPLLAEDIADIIHYIINLPDRVNIADILVLPSAQASAMNIHRG